MRIEIHTREQQRPSDAVSNLSLSRDMNPQIAINIDAHIHIILNITKKKSYSYSAVKHCEINLKIFSNDDSVTILKRIQNHLHSREIIYSTNHENCLSHINHEIVMKELAKYIKRNKDTLIMMAKRWQCCQKDMKIHQMCA